MLAVGVIALWSGSIATIPAGWHICDGTAETPDLRDRFLVGAGDTFAVDETGGTFVHTHDFTGDGHLHSIPAGFGINPGGDFVNSTSFDPGVGTTDESLNVPPYYSLAYIMRI